MNSQKKSSTKVRAKKAAPTGQRQFSNLLRSQKAALVKDNMKPQKDYVYVAKNKTMTSKGASNFQLMRTGLKSELLMTIPGSSGVDFNLVKRIRINPLSRDTFKWLPAIAQNFESFKFHLLRIRYENRCSSTTPGSVVLSPSYDSADSLAQAATEALLYENKGTKDFSVWKTESLTLSTSAMNRLYKSHTCMSDERFANTKQDLKTIDPAQAFICLDGVTAGVTTGKIFLDYDCEFFEPHAPTEPVNQGGFLADNGNPLQGNSKPFVALPVFVKEEISPIMESLTKLVSTGVLADPTISPTSVVGRLLKDYSGILTIFTDGTNLDSSNNAGAFLSDEPLSFAGSVNDIALGVIDTPVTNGGKDKSVIQFSLPEGIALAGKYIKLASQAASTINLMSAQFAATTAF
jgi:hypothetical protein